MGERAPERVGPSARIAGAAQASEGLHGDRFAFFREPSPWEGLRVLVGAIERSLVLAVRQRGAGDIEDSPFRGKGFVAGGGP
jgi:hypothetical protein